MDKTKQYLSGVGLTVSKDNLKCDATFSIELTINQLRATYTPFDGNSSQKCYSGASISSQISLSDGQKKLGFSPTKTRPTPSGLMSSSCTSSAHFVAESLYVILSVMDRIWGNAYILPFSGSTESPEDYYLFGYCLDTIRNLGGGGKIFAQQLVQCFGRNCYHYPPGTVTYSGDCPTPEERWLRTMKAITGKNFDYDIPAWESWLETQFPKP